MFPRKEFVYVTIEQWRHSTRLKSKWHDFQRLCEKFNSWKERWVGEMRIVSFLDRLCIILFRKLWDSTEIKSVDQIPPKYQKGHGSRPNEYH
jgi:hypothetical protein